MFRVALPMSTEQNPCQVSPSVSLGHHSRARRARPKDPAPSSARPPRIRCPWRPLSTFVDSSGATMLLAGVQSPGEPMVPGATLRHLDLRTPLLAPRIRCTTATHGSRTPVEGRGRSATREEVKGDDGTFPDPLWNPRVCQQSQNSTLRTSHVAAPYYSATAPGRASESTH